MSETESKGVIARFLAAPPDSVGKTIFVAVAVCLVASMIVSSAAVALRPVQEVNKLKDKQMNILQVAGLFEPGQNVAEAFKAFEPQVLELATGQFTDQFDAATFDDKAAANDAELSRALTDDPAGIGRQALYRTVYLLRDEAGGIDKVILPIHGYGLWSTLYGFIAVEENGNDIFGLQFYQHGETPGLGAEVDNPRWKAMWNGKKLRDDAGELQITVAKSQPAAGADFYVDALAGATLTSVGVDNLVRFWMGEQGYAPFLEALKAGEI
ncbi:Na(+)-translocating NADH-quinone reductase subunit C [Ruegeria pomeroyi]|uniref:Na(+)-translocating NADH-quinone reductase subunit C n=1 Tax=Ruegeria alba TaxID=2916756 RepID=A0ABS9P1E4_9RHOB|nr:MULTISPECIES: Na(+)-translocating NADH-quinone reductase subunit C [Ruegeria]MCE8509154.1 Na(+)-translocating NADH-quinone reductase subunit C [Ruegeria pomeroyi]MCE8516770.1 Na(+)-translocating NADH-quinone reductase subunit C [Ruegeria pomeroyi]MCE8522957.1 Na(+)-translocating NADH-quinone reductase subunit C [Ruegeria pomeroyi]MCE8525498.1 Na(+)-translocating NADH-quinone reductase subunit C [Ruegeria pomeroyi]MCE8535400.1 Na(+)-translocating NADH-quinone reductase subunit C [Ruegeria po